MLNYNNNGCRIYVDIMTREKLSPIQLANIDSFIGQFGHTVGGEGVGYGEWKREA